MGTLYPEKLYAPLKCNKLLVYSTALTEEDDVSGLFYGTLLVMRGTSAYDPFQDTGKTQGQYYQQFADVYDYYYVKNYTINARFMNNAGYNFQVIMWTPNAGNSGFDTWDQLNLQPHTVKKNIRSSLLNGDQAWLRQKVYPKRHVPLSTWQNQFAQVDDDPQQNVGTYFLAMNQSAVATINFTIQIFLVQYVMFARTNTVPANYIPPPV